MSDDGSVGVALGLGTLVLATLGVYHIIKNSPCMNQGESIEEDKEPQEEIDEPTEDTMQDEEAVQCYKCSRTDVEECDMSTCDHHYCPNHRGDSQWCQRCYDDCSYTDDDDDD